jgi:hypothetical protein
MVLRAQKKGRKKEKQKKSRIKIRNKRRKKRRKKIRKIMTLGFMQVMKEFVNASDRDEDFSMRLFLISSRMDNTWIYN